MARRQSSSTAAVLASGGRVPVLALRRDPRDEVLLRGLFGRSRRLEVDVVGPDGLVRTPLRWPGDPRAVPMALCLVLRSRPGTIRAAQMLARHVGDLPVVALVDDRERIGPSTDLADALRSVGVDDVIGCDGLTCPVFEHVVLAAIDRHDRGILHLRDATDVLLGEREHLHA